MIQFCYNIKREIAIRTIEKEYNCPHYPEPFPKSMKSAAPIRFQKCQQNWNTNIGKLLSDSPIKHSTAIYIFYVFIHPAFPVSSPPHYLSVATKMPHLYFLKDAVYDTPNPFFSQPIQKEFERITYKIQSAYYAFCKIARLWKLRKYKVQQTADLYMNELSPTSKYTYKLIQEHSIFYFSLTDLKQIVLNSLTATSGFFSMPSIIKNPYNGVPLTKSDIYNIYFKMTTILFKMPHLFTLFYECEFNINEFKRKHESAILEYVVEQYISTSTHKTIMPETMRMIRAFDRTNIICLKDEEKIAKLVDFMRRPYFSLHLLKKYTVDNTKRHNIGIELSWRIKRFISFYSHYGESTFFNMISSETERNKIKKSLETTHVKYEWLNNHKYDDPGYNRYVQYGGFGISQPEPLAFRPRSYGTQFREEIEREQREMRIVWSYAARPSAVGEPPRVRRLLEFENSAGELELNQINSGVDALHVREVINNSHVSHNSSELYEMPEPLPTPLYRTYSLYMGRTREISDEDTVYDEDEDRDAGDRDDGGENETDDDSENNEYTEDDE